MPKDRATPTELSNAIIDQVSREIDFFHLPVPQDHRDAGYLAPLADLKLGAETKLYLGLIHYDDMASDRARMAAAAKVCKNFGVASECGWGQAEPGRLEGFLKSHNQAAEHLS